MTRRSERRQPMFDFTPLAQGVAGLLLAYLIAVLIALVVVVMINVTFGEGPDGIDFVWWPVPIAFPIGSLVLVVDYFRRLPAGRLSTTQVSGYRAAAATCLLGASFGLDTSWIPAVICLVVLVGLVLFPRASGPPRRPGPRHESGRVQVMVSPPSTAMVCPVT